MIFQTKKNGAIFRNNYTMQGKKKEQVGQAGQMAFVALSPLICMRDDVSRLVWGYVGSVREIFVEYQRGCDKDTQRPGECHKTRWACTCNFQKIIVFSSANGEYGCPIWHTERRLDFYPTPHQTKRIESCRCKQLKTYDDCLEKNLRRCAVYACQCPNFDGFTQSLLHGM